MSELETKVVIERTVADGKISGKVVLFLPGTGGIFGSEFFERSYEGNFYYGETETSEGLPYYRYVLCYKGKTYVRTSPQAMLDVFWDAIKEDARRFVTYRLKQRGYRIVYMFFHPYGFSGTCAEVEVSLAKIRKK